MLEFVIENDSAAPHPNASVLQALALQGLGPWRQRILPQSVDGLGNSLLIAPIKTSQVALGAGEQLDRKGRSG
ncbi:MAG TPA: hypothetical protein VGG06_33355 [Thermoanaerobaculia bacterium]